MGTPQRYWRRQAPRRQHLAILPRSPLRLKARSKGATPRRTATTTPGQQILMLVTATLTQCPLQSLSLLWIGVNIQRGLASARMAHRESGKLLARQHSSDWQLLPSKASAGGITTTTPPTPMSSSMQHIMQWEKGRQGVRARARQAGLQWRWNSQMPRMKITLRPLRPRM